MRNYTEVTLPTKLKPVFPPRCVVCEEATDELAKITVDTSNVLSSFLLPILFLFGWKRIEFPVCRYCRTTFFLQRWGRQAILILIASVTIYFVMPMVNGWNRQLAKLILVAIAVAVLIPYFLVEQYFPNSFNVTAYKKYTEFEFLSSDYAIEFFTLNKLEYPDAEIKFEDETFD